MRKWKLSLRIKLFFSYVMMVLSAILCIALLVFVRCSEILEAQAKNWNLTSLDQAQSLLSHKIDHLSYVLDLLVSNASVQKILRQNKNYYPLKEQIADVRNFEQLTATIKNNDPIVDVKMYVSNVRYENQNSTFYSLDSLRQTSLYNRLILSKNKIYWSQQQPLQASQPERPDIVSAYLCVRNPDDYQIVEAVLQLDFLKKDLLDSLSQAIQNTGGSIFLLNADIEAIASVEENPELSFGSLQRDIWRQIQQYAYQWEPLAVNGETLYASVRKIDGTDWYLTALIPSQAIVREVVVLRDLILLLSLGIVAASLLVATFLSKFITVRIQRLSYAMNEVQKGNWEIRVPIRGHDEIAQLKEDFDYMLLQIRRLTDEKVDAVARRKDAELLALQSQINPHFLYNSLDSINWMAFEHHVPEIQKMVAALARFYRIALSEGKTVIPLAEELSHVQTYVNIQNIRYGDQIDFQVQVDSRYHSRLIPKITLQPIVENAILHGIMKKDSKRGTIRIWSERDAESLLLLISDDGVGIPAGRIAPLLTEGDSRSYGLKNVNLRLKKYYGDSCGLSFRSSPEGTVVTVRIPLERQDTLE